LGFLSVIFRGWLGAGFAAFPATAGPTFTVGVENARTRSFLPLPVQLAISLTIIRSTDMRVIAIHPGEHLAEELKALDMSAAELARRLDVPTNRITQIVNGTRAITGDTALRLAHFFGTSAEFWLNLQSLYDLRLARKKKGKAIGALPTLKRRDLVHA